MNEMPQEWENMMDELLRKLRMVSEQLDRINGNLKEFNTKAGEVVAEVKATIATAQVA
jgi:hypothetical protein